MAKKAKTTPKSAPSASSPAPGAAASKPDILFVHNNFPGQFGFLAAALMQRGHRCFGISAENGKGVPGVGMARWKLHKGTTPNIFPFAVRAEADLMRGEAAAKAAYALKEHGVDPALIVGHPGWGETVFLRDIFPQARQILYGEYYYRFKGGDAGFDPEFKVNVPAETMRIHAKNASQLLGYVEADVIVSPTPFQAARFPKNLTDRIRVIHEGVDTTRIRPNPDAEFTLANGRRLTRADKVVTMINRRFEPLRGYHIFMRALPAMMARNPDAQFVLIGADQPGGYGMAPPRGKTWGKFYLDEVRDRIDMTRLHFVGMLPHDQMLALVALSSAHIYYTYPFILSWSLMEAMALEAPIIASDTPPVRDALVDGVNARLLSFFDIDALSQTVTEALNHPDRFTSLRQQARRDVIRNYDRNSLCLPQWLALIDEQLALVRPTP